MTSERVELRARSAPSRCVVCHDDVARTRPATCDACGAVAHRGCARELARCPTIGCAGALVTPVDVLVPGAPARARGRAAAIAAAVMGVVTALGLFVATREEPLQVVIAGPGGVEVPPSRTLSLEDPFAEERRRWHAREAHLARRLAALGDGSTAALAFFADALLGGDADARLAAVDALGREDPTWSRIDLRPCLDPALEPDARVRAVAAVRMLEVARLDERAARDVVAAFGAREKDEPERLVWAILRLGLLEHEARSPGPWVEAAVDAVIDTALTAPERPGAACRDLLRALAPQEPVCAVLLGELAGADAPRRALAAASLEPAAEVEVVSYRNVANGSVTELREGVEVRRVPNLVHEALVTVRERDVDESLRRAAAASVAAAEERPVHVKGRVFVCYGPRETPPR